MQNWSVEIENTLFAPYNNLLTISSFLAINLFTVPFNSTWTLKYKSQLLSIIINNNNNQQTVKKTNKQSKGIRIYQSQPTDVTFWTRQSKFLFPERATNMIDGSKTWYWWLSRVHMLLKGIVKGICQVVRPCSEVT